MNLTLKIAVSAMIFFFALAFLAGALLPADDMTAGACFITGGVFVFFLVIISVRQLVRMIRNAGRVHQQ